MEKNYCTWNLFGSANIITNQNSYHILSLFCQSYLALLGQYMSTLFVFYNSDLSVPTQNSIIWSGVWYNQETLIFFSTLPESSVDYILFRPQWLAGQKSVSYFVYFEMIRFGFITEPNGIPRPKPEFYYVSSLMLIRRWTNFIVSTVLLFSLICIRFGTWKV